jgi:cytidine deaminase
VPKVDSTEFKKLLSHLPAPAAQLLQKIMAADDFCGVISAADAQALATELGITMQQLMLQLTPFASLYAVPPISNFYVGAVAQGLTGDLYYGANMEFMGEPLSLCTHGEQSATYNAWVHGEQGLSALAVNAAPCGYCRQFLYELVTASQLQVIFNDSTGTLVIAPISTVLPWAFGPQDLGVQGGLLEPLNHNLVLALPSESPAVLGALSAANMCYAPYTSSYAGVGVLTSGGQVYSAPLAENAAYNPSMSPLEGALSYLNLCGNDYSQIQEVALVQVQGAEVSQQSVTEAALSSVSTVELTMALAIPSDMPRAVQRVRIAGGYPPTAGRTRSA